MASMALEGRRRYAGFLAVPGTMATSVGGPRCRWGRNAGDPLVLQRHSALSWRGVFCARNERESAAPTRRAARRRLTEHSADSGAPVAAPPRAHVAEQRWAPSEHLAQ